MNLPKTPPELLDLFGRVAPTGPNITHKKVFGFPACFVNGNMFAGLHGDSFIIRLSQDDRAELLKTDGAHIFEPMPGRPMKEYVVAPDVLLKDVEGPTMWLTRSLIFVSSMPAKEAKAKKKA